MKGKLLARKFLKMLLLGTVIAIINIVAFSKAFFGISIHSENKLITTFSIFIPIMSLFTFFYVSYSILNAKEKRQYRLDMAELKEPENYKDAIRKYIKIFPFLSNELESLLMQIKRMEIKEQALEEYLKQNNQTDNFLLQEGKDAQLFLLSNVKRVLNKCIIMGALDKDDTNSRNVYQKQIDEFHEIIKSNEKNLDEFDIFLEEVSKIKEKPLSENIGLQCTIQAMRQLRGADSITNYKEV